MADVTTAPRETRDDRAPDPLTRLWCVRLPRALDPWAPPLADALADGAWTAAWPGVAALAPLAALAVGFLAPLAWPGIKYIYSESLTFLMLVVAAAILSAPLGVGLLAGYIGGVMVFGGASSYYAFAQAPLARVGSLVIAYMLLALPAVTLPQLGRRMADELALLIPSSEELRRVARPALYAVTAALLTFLWCQATVVLIRPVFTWMRGSPTVEAVRNVQVYWRWLVVTAVLAVIARTVLEWGVARRAGVVAALEAERWSEPHRRWIQWRRLPLAVRVGLASLAVTLLLAGAYTGWIDAVLMALAVAALAAWRAGLIGGTLPATWHRLLLKVPTLVRYAVAALVGYWLAGIATALLWKTGSFRPVLLGIFASLAMFYVLLPRPPEAPAGGRAGGVA